MINARPGKVFTAVAEGFAAGLAGTIGVRIENTDGTNELARATAGIVELEATSGVYAKDDLVAPAEPGSYVLLWDNGDDPPLFASEELVVSWVATSPPAGDVDWAPSVDEVGALLRTRTKISNGDYLGTFTDATRPTEEEAQRLIDQAVADVVMRVTENVPAELEPSARYAAALRAAMLIELSYFPEQTTENLTAYQSLRLTYDEVIGKLVSAVQVRSLFAETEPEEVEA